VFRLIKADTILRLDDTQIEILENGTFLSSDINKLCDEISELVEYFNSGECAKEIISGCINKKDILSALPIIKCEFMRTLLATELDQYCA
jgi:hypothetical protein